MSGFSQSRSSDSMGEHTTFWCPQLPGDLLLC